MESTTGRAPWLEPKTLLGTVALFTVGYAAWQPLAHVLLHWMLRRPIAFSSLAEWSEFIVTCAGLGAFAGLVWFYGTREPSGSRLRAWTKACATMLAMAVVISADEFAQLPISRWLFVTIFTAVVTGTLFFPFYRWSDQYEQKQGLRPHAAEPVAAPDNAR